MILVALLLASAPPEAAPLPQENLLRGPARCVLRYLEAVRMAGPRAAEVPRAGARRVVVRETAYAAARRLTAPDALAEIARASGDGQVHPLAPWQEAAGGRVLERFQLLAVRRATHGAAIVTVREVFWQAREPDEPLAREVSEYLVARVGGAWRVVARRPGGAFDDAEIAGYAGWFDPPPEAGPLSRPDAGSEAAVSR